MNPELSSFATRLHEIISSEGRVPRGPNQKNGNSWNSSLRDFDSLALELFSLQFKHNAAYRKICEARQRTPANVCDWTQIPFVPTSAFKELELTSLPPEERTTVFHSSGTTEQKPSRHFHCAESLAVYEASLWASFRQNCGVRSAECGVVFLTPPPEAVPHSSLVHMFEVVRQKMGITQTAFCGQLGDDGAWMLDFNATLAALNSAIRNQESAMVLGTAFSFVHLLDHLTEKNLLLKLPSGSRVMETGGYKNRSRSMSKAELHALIAERLGVARENIVCEYGMSELSSQAYDSDGASRRFHFPSWARVQILSPETGREVADGEMGLIRIFDLANVFSVAAIQTEDLGIRCGDGFELVGRAQLAEPRGCSLMTA